MIYRHASMNDLPRLVTMVDQAKASFKSRGIDQWQRGEPNQSGLAASIEQHSVHVLEDAGTVVGMIMVAFGPEASYESIDGAWINEEPYAAFHRVCVEESQKGQGLAALLFSESEKYAAARGCRNIRIDTHPHNISMQKALAKSGYTLCGCITLREGNETGAPRIAFQKVL